MVATGFFKVMTTIGNIMQLIELLDNCKSGNKFAAERMQFIPKFNSYLFYFFSDFTPLCHDGGFVDVWKYFGTHGGRQFGFR